MKDWKGNTVKAGDTVVRIRIQDDHSFYPTAFYMLRLNKDGSSSVENEVKMDAPPEQKGLWEEVDRYDVFVDRFEHNGKTISYLAYKRMMNDGGTYIMPLDDHVFVGEPNPEPRIITCIAGKSDDRDEYYLKQFEA